jgi:hypothetical protein
MCVDRNNQVWLSDDEWREFRARNAVARPVPSVALPNVTSIAVESTPGRRPFDRYPRAAAFVGVSAPVYLRSGDAVIYIEFICGALCCHTWFLLLERTPAGWRVSYEREVAIC